MKFLSRTEGCELDIQCDRLIPIIPIPRKLGFFQSEIHRYSHTSNLRPRKKNVALLQKCCTQRLENGLLEKYPETYFSGRDAIRCDRGLRSRKVPEWHPPPELVGPFWPGLDRCRISMKFHSKLGGFLRIQTEILQRL